MGTLNNLTIADARDGLQAGKFSSTELTDDCISAMESARELNAFITETPEIARKSAAASDARRSKNESLGPLDGIPIAIKDLFCTRDTLTTAGSHILDGFTPAYESTVTQNLIDAGAVMIGKTNLDEFAMGSGNLTSYHGSVKNPWTGPTGENLVPGGSSGGSAVSVAANICPGSIGTDTGGSIRQPASLCGIVGMKPTYGRCSRWGTVAFASSLDQAGPFSRTVLDNALLLRTISGHDPKDSTSSLLAVPDFEAAINDSVKTLKVGIPEEYTLSGMPDEIKALWDQGANWLRDAGAEIKDVSLPHTKYALPAYYIVAPAEASSNLARYDGVRYGLRIDGQTLDEMYENTRGKGFGPEVRRRIMIGTYVLSAGYYDAYYVKAQQVRTIILEEFKRVFEEVDVLLTPTAPNAAFPIDREITDPVTMYLNDVFTVPANMAGLPGISIPAGLDNNGLPLGLQIVAKPFDEETMFRAASALERSANFTAKPRYLGGQ